MKRLITLLLLVLISSTGFSQSKKTPAKKPVSKPAEEVQTSLDAGTAGRYAKDLGKKMYYRTDFEAEKGSHSMSINKWKPFKVKKDDGSVAYWYMIDVTIRWKSSQGGWPVTWHDVEYNGVILADEFGCDVNLLIKTKTEPSSKGLNALVVKKSPVGELTDQQKQAFAMTDDWFQGVNYVWNPGGCLE